MWGYRVAHRQTDRQASFKCVHFKITHNYTLGAQAVSHCLPYTHMLWFMRRSALSVSDSDCTAFDPNDEMCENGVLELLWMCQSGLLLSVTQKLQHVFFFLHYWRVDSISIHNMEFESNWLSLNWLNRMLTLKDRKLNSKFTELELCIFLTSSNISNVIHSSNVFKNYFEIEFHFKC